MGRRLAYPNVSPSKIHEIYSQSLRQPIHALAFFVDPLRLYRKKKGHPDSPTAYTGQTIGAFLSKTISELESAGLHTLSIASIPIPRQLRTVHSPDYGWLVILGTGFDKSTHVSIPDELVQRVQAILETEEQPLWWSMKGFTYPPPKPWIQYTTTPIQEPLD